MDFITFYSTMALVFAVVLVAHGRTMCAVVARSDALVDLARLLAVLWLVACVVLPKGIDRHALSALSVDAVMAWAIYRASGRFDLTWATLFMWIALSWLGHACRPGG